jgi:hypothetical protein
MSQSHLELANAALQSELSMAQQLVEREKIRTYKVEEEILAGQRVRA